MDKRILQYSLLFIISLIIRPIVSDSDSEHNSTITLDTPKLWPNGVVPYIFPDKLSESMKQSVREALTAMTVLTFGCVRFMELNDTTNITDYVRIVRGLDCSSDVGRMGGKQVITLQPGCMNKSGEIQHQFMHTLGFYHEHGRSDRDKYILVNWDNIDSGDRMQFRKLNFETFGLPYDYASVMHYPWNAFAIDNAIPTIVPLKRDAAIGQLDNLSQLDVVRIRMLYKCQMPKPSELKGLCPIPVESRADCKL